MKKLIIVLVIMALMLLTWGSLTPAQPQESTNEEKPTFYRLVPGTYVNGWPRFTIHYPKDWIEKRFAYGGLFMAMSSGRHPMVDDFSVHFIADPWPLDKYVDFLVPYFRAFATDVTVVSNKSSQLRDGTPAQEVEIKMVINGIPRNFLDVGTDKGGILISVGVSTPKGTIGEDLRAIPYSLQYEPGKDEPVKLPPDVQEFFEKVANDILSHDLAKVMANYSDKYLKSGMRKGEEERYLRDGISQVTSSKMTITDFVPAGDRAYYTGFGRLGIRNQLFTVPFNDSIIKESGEWKFYGNQRDVSPW
jgi:hypothetical protein